MQFDQAKADLVKANKLEPTNKEILEAFKIFKQKKYEYKYKTQKIWQTIFDKENSGLYKEKEQVKEEEEEVKEQKSIAGYLNVIVQVGLAVPLVIYKKVLERPTVFALGVGEKVLSLTDRIPICGCLCKRTRSGAANIVRRQFSKLLDKTKKE